MNTWRTGPEYDIPWARYPFVKIVIPFSLGILFADWAQSLFLIGAILLIPLSGLLFYFHRLAVTKFKFVYWFGWAVSLFWFLSGLVWASFRDERKLPHHFFKSDLVTQELVAEIDYLDEKAKYFDCYSRVLQRVEPSGLKAVGGNLLIRIPKNTGFVPTNRDVIQGIYRIRTPSGASAPYEFDWKSMLDRRNIHYYTYLDTLEFRVINRTGPTILETTRVRLDQIIQTLIPSTRDYPVATAMLLGLRKKMDPELYQAYSATGAVHILAVSGLHVGIIAHIFQFLFSFISFKGRKLKVLQVVLILLVIWGYTFLTGAAPSILRSALMFSLLHVSRLLQRDAPSMNILAAAAFILLCINPYDLYNLGFQLSFAAMAGIFILYEPIRSLISTEYVIIQSVWKVLAVSMAAQLVIYPFIGYHFHQFAFYFWLTGLLSTPFSYLILVSGIFTLILYPVCGPILHWIGLPLQYSIKWMNDSVAWIYTLPLGRIQGWWPTPLDVTLLLAMSLLAGYLYFQKTRFSFLIFLLTCIVFFAGMIVEEKLDQNKSEIVAGGTRDKRFVWIKNKQNTIIYKMDDTPKLPIHYLEKYNLPVKNQVYFNPGVETYSSGHLFLTGNTIHYKHEVYHLILKGSDTVVHKPHTQSLIILLDHLWTPGPDTTNTYEIYAPDFISFSDRLYGDRLRLHQSESPYVRIRLK